MADKYEEILSRYWGYDSFRNIQRDIIESIMAGRDTLGLMPTGGGKSITFQVPAMAMEGVCIVVTPLIALMIDQVAHLRQRGIPAACIHSGMSRKETIAALENAVFGGVKILYVSPERLSSSLFIAKFNHMKVSFVTVDEAHCICQWGYDFRPSYLEISQLRQLKPDIPFLALTATATPQVADDIQKQLVFREPNVLRMSFKRDNLAYVVRKTYDKEHELIHILQATQGSAIVYVRNRARSRELSITLSKAGIKTTFYHAGLEAQERLKRQEQWQNGQVRVVVATNAFGMGIDKPNVRLVIHYDCPDSIEAYFQEAGRAGRDGKKAYAVLLWMISDPKLLAKRIDANFPPKEFVCQVYEHLAYYLQVGVGSGAEHTFPFEIQKFSYNFHHQALRVESALRILESSGYIHYESDPEARARLMFTLKRNELYRLHENSPQEEAVIDVVLRQYGNLFSDYAFIDVQLIAQRAKLTPDQAYQALKALSHKHIVHFIPQRSVPLLSYVVDRVDGDKVVIPPAAYDLLKDKYVARINAIIAYASNDAVCRSRQLTRYFGDETTDDCGMCDVCLASKSDD